MQSKDLLLLANQQCAVLVLPLLEDLKSAPLVSATAVPGNHAHWVLGHLVVSEGRFRTIMDGTPNPFDSLQSMFGGQSVPVADGQGYPEYAKLLQQLQELHQGMLEWIGGLNEADLDRRSHEQLPGFDVFFGTWRQVLMMRAMHWMNHRGQLADCRHSAGRPPLMV